jgi:hypothetical protein
MLLRLKLSEELAGGAFRPGVLQRARVKRHRSTQEFRGEDPHCLFRERLEGLEKPGRSPTHTPRLAPFNALDKFERLARLKPAAPRQGCDILRGSSTQEVHFLESRHDRDRRHQP